MPKDKKKTEQEQEEQQSRFDYKIEDAPEEKEKKVNYGLEVDITEEQETDILDHINTTLKDYEEKREELGLETLWQQNEDQYYGNLPDKTFPFEYSSNQNVPMTREKVDVVLNDILAAKHTPEEPWEVRPLEIGSESIDKLLDACDAKAKFLAYEVKNELNYEEEDSAAGFDAVVHGTGMLELPWHYELDFVRDVEVYEGEKDLEKFRNNFVDVDKEYPGYVRQLKNDKTIEVVVEYLTPKWDNPKPQHVPIRKFWINPYVIRIEDSRLHGKEYELSGSELTRKVEDGIFNNIDSVDELQWVQDKTGIKQINDFMKRKFRCYTLVMRYTLTEGGDDKKYVVDIIKDENTKKEKILRIREYPYWHNRSYFIPQHIVPRKSDCFYREGLCEILADSQDMSNISLNFYLDALLFSSIPLTKANAAHKKKLQPQLNKGVYPGLTLWLDNQDDVDFTTTKGVRLDNLFETIQLGMKFGQVQSGVGPYMSGKESPSDPRAPAEKTRMLIRQANKKISGFINEIQKTNREVAFQLIELYYQFKPEGKEYRVLGESGSYAFNSITRKELRQRTEYSPVGSIETISKGLKMQDNIQVLTMINKDKFFNNPALFKNKRYIYENIFKDMGGVWEKSVAKMLPTEEELKEQEVEMKAQAMVRAEQIKAEQQRFNVIKQRAQQLRQQGLNREQIQKVIKREFGGENGRIRKQAEAPEAQAQPRERAQERAGTRP